jgi:cellulose synthase (UDP-forming)
MSVLAPTIAGAVAIRYPHRTYVLDDGRRPWVKQLCRRMGAEYLTREDNKGAKAGNINAALKKTSGDFVAVVDADFIPSPDYIHDLLGYFRDEKVAVVQGPQEFYNLDSFQHISDDAERWNEQTLFFRTIQPGKNHQNAAFWCGCPSLLRRSAIEAIGGVAMETVTEDLHTSIKLHEHGWRSVYHPGVVALGIAPNDYDGFILQRLRWAEGTMQVIRRAWNTRRLTLGQRINYIASTSTYFDAVRKAVFLSIVPLVLITDQLPVSASMSVFLPFWLVHFVFGTTATNMLGRGNNRPLMTEFFDTLKMFAFIRASFTLITGHRPKFKVTPKGQPGERRVHNLLMPFILIIGCYAVSVTIGLLRLAGFGLGTANPAAMVAAVLWGLMIAVFLAEVTAYGVRKVSQRQADRVSLKIDGELSVEGSRTWEPVSVEDLTTMGASVVSLQAHPAGTRARIRFSRNSASFRSTVRRATKVNGNYFLGLEIIANEKAQADLARLIASGLFANPVWSTASGHAPEPALITAA